MEERADDVPLPPRRLRVGVIYNGKKENAPGSAPDAEAEYDNPETVEALLRALRAAGCEAEALEADETLPEALRARPIDLAFNIAEGRGGRGREAQVPALLHLLGIPFTGSDETALAVSMDKELCKRVLSSYGVATPHSAVIARVEELSALTLRYPVIVKPNAEGSSKGVGEACVAADAAALRALVERNLALYGESMLCEEYLPGREFTVGLLGNGGTLRVFPPMEIVFRGNTQGKYRVYSYGVKQNYKRYISYRCPAPLTAWQAQTMEAAARTAFHALGCHDLARVDFRLDKAGRPQFIEINPLPGLAPGYSDYPMLAEFSGVGYEALVESILRAARRRLGMEAAV